MSKNLRHLAISALAFAAVGTARAQTYAQASSPADNATSSATDTTIFERDGYTFDRTLYPFVKDARLITQPTRPQVKNPDLTFVNKSDTLVVQKADGPIGFNNVKSFVVTDAFHATATAENYPNVRKVFEVYYDNQKDVLRRNYMYELMMIWERRTNGVQNPVVPLQNKTPASKLKRK